MDVNCVPLNEGAFIRIIFLQYCLSIGMFVGFIRQAQIISESPEIKYRLEIVCLVRKVKLKPNLF